jgi:rhodanese-related sulfurtransferase
MANKVTSKELLETKDQYTYVDVRETDELEEGKIDAAVNIPLGQLIRKARHSITEYSHQVQQIPTTRTMINVILFAALLL